MKTYPLVVCCLALVCTDTAHADRLSSDSGVKMGANRPVQWKPATNSREFEAELKRQGYTSPGGLSVTDKSGKPLDGDVVLTNGIIVNRRIKKFWFAYVTIPERDGNGRAIYQLEDAFEYALQGREEPLLGNESGCVSRAAPKLQVIAIGVWKWRKNPGLGGYAHSIKHAWLADPSIKKLRPVPVESVGCEINEDRD